MDSLFELANAFVLRWEGGFSEDAGDPGGATQYGVSLAFLRDAGASGGRNSGDIDGDGDVDRDDVRAVRPAAEAGLFRAAFWEDRAATLPGPLAVAYYDTAVNTGNRRATLLLQQAVGAEQDGLFGPATRAAARAAAAAQTGIRTAARATVQAAARATARNVPGIGEMSPPRVTPRAADGALAVAFGMLDARDAFYRRLAERRPASARFLKGWLNRTADLRRLLARTFGTPGMPGTSGGGIPGSGMSGTSGTSGTSGSGMPGMSGMPGSEMPGSGMPGTSGTSGGGAFGRGTSGTSGTSGSRMPRGSGNFLTASPAFFPVSSRPSLFPQATPFLQVSRVLHVLQAPPFPQVPQAARFMKSTHPCHEAPPFPQASQAARAPRKTPILHAVSNPVTRALQKSGPVSGMQGTGLRREGA